MKRTINPEQFSTIENSISEINQAAGILAVMQNALAGTDGDPDPASLADAVAGVETLLRNVSKDLDTLADEILKGKLEITEDRTSKEEGNENKGSKWTIIRRAEYEGTLAPCKCGARPDVYEVDPVGLYVRHVLKDERFFAVRCNECGRTGKPTATGMNILGNHIDAARAAAIAAESWNRERSED